MSRRAGRNVFGPYHQEDRGRWQVVSVGPNGKGRRVRYFRDPNEAEVYAALLRNEIGQDRSIGDAVTAFVADLQDRERATATVKLARYRLEGLLPQNLPLQKVTPELVAKRLQVRKDQGKSVDTLIGELSSARVFVAFCTKQGWLAGVDLSDLEVKGRRRRGKPQLTVDEGRRYLAAALEYGPKGVAAAMPLLMGLRSQEVLSRVARDVDDDGRLFWIRRGKTERSNRRVEIPEILQAPLSAIAADLPPDGLLFPGRTGGVYSNTTLLRWVHEVCDLAGVPRVPTHGLRGTHATLAEDAGVSSHAVAATLGHTSDSMTGKHYTMPTVREQARGRRAVLRLVG